MMRDTSHEFQPIGEQIERQRDEFERMSDPSTSAPASASSTVRSPLTAESTRPCAMCGEAIGTFPYRRGAGIAYMWCVCPCREQAYAEEAAFLAAQDAAERQAAIERAVGDTGLHQIAGMTLEAFNPNRLRGAAHHPYAAATRWLEAALQYGTRASYHDPASPPAALFFYSGGKGRGKTHLAAGIAHEAKRQHQLVVFIEEQSYLRRRWGTAFEEVDRLVSLPGERAWLTVIDDLGQRRGMRNPDTVADVWYEVINARWLKGGWTIITSNLTPDELLAQGTLNEASYSRLGQMIKGAVVFFDGTDARLEGIV